VLLLLLPSGLQLRCCVYAVLLEPLHVTTSTAATGPGAAELRGEEGRGTSKSSSLRGHLQQNTTRLEAALAWAAAAELAMRLV
jgi:hypothetical protein